MGDPTPLTPTWWPFLRRLVIFALGVAIVIDAFTDKQYVVPELIIGMIMIGILPLDDFAHLLRRNGRGPPRRTGPPD